MPSAEVLKEAGRILTICNACRYCEGFCAVFPAMELRRTFADKDLTYLANLCHNCRGCYYACQYAPPHEFGINVPKTFSTLRVETYQDFAWPRFLGILFQHNGLAVSLITIVSVAVVGLFTFLVQDPAVLFSAQSGQGAFYVIVPYLLMVVPASLLGVFILAAFAVGFHRFWRATGGTWSELVNLRAVAAATWDALRLRYLEGGGHGCNYPDGRFSYARKWLHQLTFFGFLLDFAATTVAAIYHHFWHWEAPYPYLSLPVVLGTVGGVGVLIGTAGLLWLKRRSEPEPADQGTLSMDVSFLVLLFLTAFTGLLLLALRETAVMGTLLTVHLGVVLALFMSLPYGKFVHAIYRYAALVKYAMERQKEAA